MSSEFEVNSCHLSSFNLPSDTPNLPSSSETDVSVFLDYYFTYFYAKARSYAQPYINIKFNVDKVIEGLYIGDFASACNLEQLLKLGITHVVTVLSGVGEMYPDYLNYKTIDACDRHWDSNRLYNNFDETSKFISDAINKGGKVYVHCMYGVSRSATMVCAYLIYKHGMSCDEAIAFLKSKRPCINPIAAFRQKLKYYAEHVTKNTTELTKLSDIKEIHIEPKEIVDSKQQIIDTTVNF